MNLIDEIPEEWFDAAAPVGKPTRYRHPDCSEGKDQAMAIIKTDLGWWVRCFRCKRSGFKPAINLSPKQMMKWQEMKREAANEFVPEIKLPDDFIREIPAEGLAWIYSCAATDEDIAKYGIGYSPHRNRVILPLYQDGELVYWQGRLLDEPSPLRPKYVNQAKANRHDIWFNVVDMHTDYVVVVEDIMSCIAVGKVADCYALLNASVPDRLIFKLGKEYRRILLWLDPDKHVAMNKWCVRYQSFGFDVGLVKTDKDPKYYDREEIERACKN